MEKAVLCVVILLFILVPASAQLRISAGAAVVWNLLPGFGLGSFCQGDLGGGGMQLAFEAFGWFFIGLYIAEYVGGEYPGYADPLNLIQGELVLIPCYIFAIVRPFRYEKIRTRQKTGRVTFDMVPSLEPCIDRRGSDFRMELAVIYTL